MAEGDFEPPSVYELRPPEWLPKAHTTADVGYMGFYPPRPDEDEEVLTETNIKNGFVLNLSVPAETYSTQDTIRNSLIHENALGELENLMEQIFIRRAENFASPVPASTFRLPSRVTLNDMKRKAWFADLANPDVPLYKLGKNVPHGAKGHDLLDLLHTNNVAIPRAVWFLRVFGGNETAGLRNKPGYNPTQYSVEWANVVTGYLKKQLADIALPTAPRPGLNIKQTFKSVLADPDSRERWISRFTYSLELLRTFYAEGLVDNRTFLTWLVQQMCSCNLAQLGFVVRLADEYLDGMLVSRALTHHFIDACLSKVVEIRTASARDHLVNVETLIKNLILRAFLALPDAFVSPRTWLAYGELLEEDLIGGGAVDSSDSILQQNANTLRQSLQDSLSDVRRRNEAMIFRHLPPRVVGSLTSALSDIKLLNSLSGKTNMDSIVFFDNLPDSQSSFTRKLDILLTWSVTPLQYGDHRPYAAGCLLGAWREKAGERAIRHEAASPDEYLQDQLFDWLDCSADADNSDNIPAVTLLFGQLVKRGLFSYQQYMQRLIARGEPGISYNQEGRSRHLELLRCIPLHSADSSLISQRKVTLYGVRARETLEDTNEREIRKELRALFPELFGGIPSSSETLTAKLRENCPTLLSACRYEQVKTVKQWLLPILQKHSSQAAAAGGKDILITYTLAAVLMARTKCYGSMLDLTLHTLKHAATFELMTAVIRTLRQHMEIWACMNVMKIISTALYSAHDAWRGNGIRIRALLFVLMEFDNGQYLSPEQREQVLSDITQYSHALHPIGPFSNPVPAVLPEILLLAADPHPDAPSNLAENLWYKYMKAEDWAWKVWDNTIASLRQIPVMIPDIEGRRVCALRYAQFLWHVDQHLPRGLDAHILDWLLGAGKNEIAALTPEAWDVVIVVLLHLCAYGALETTTILQGLIYPVWQASALVTSTEQGSALEIRLAAVNGLFNHLLIKDECGTGLPPMNIFEAQGLQTRRRDVFREPHFSPLVDNLSMLVLVEHNPSLAEHLRTQTSSLRETICRIDVFRQGVYRDLDAVRYAFEKLLENGSIAEDMHEPLVAALRLMLRNPEEADDGIGFVSVSSLLTPWKLAATSIEIRLTLKQLGESLARESTRHAANMTLDKLTAFVFKHCRTSEEVDFVAEMMTEVSREVAGKFVNAGLRRMVELFKGPYNPPRMDEVGDFVTNAGEVLRLLSKIVERFREDTSLPPLIPATQNQFMEALDTRLTQVKDVLVAEQDGVTDEEITSPASHCAILLCRLLQFVFGFPEAWTPQVKNMSESLCNTIVQLALVHGEGFDIGLVAFPLLLDTLYFVLDEIPSDPKLTTLDPFYRYPNLEPRSFSPDMPLEYQSRLRALLPYTALNATVSNLSYATRDPSGALAITQPVQNRPWEWTEYLGDIPPGEANLRHEDRPEERLPLRNTASISLELFGTRQTGDHIVHVTEDSMTEATIKTFQDNLSSESIFMRDWRETRVFDDEVISKSRSENEDDPPMSSAFATAQSPSQTQSERPSSSSRRGSPALSARSGRASLPNSGSSIRQSPAQQHPLSKLSASTASEPIDVDAFDISAVAGGSKRKQVDDDMDVEVVEGPARTYKKQKAKVSAKVRVKKR
ncbi:uncharacterized protein LAESUDRAFT_666096 [Laetiporus sulphureus 93-53]|uniref:Mediator of RNA polymerase II transcription subunit 12 n=1 Tax=Laetiporus sulphureus 93-53 TaxID=1314785 RepID=A0A165B831_9APHY|nr:uncharacterized protein LAESUDRAFT_666096 [Laetiporus sulphureus 93-53]KZT00461.1 hypothetical protein LAESUDRAFT_666096 [Laetiporus sulphureus 93-53]